MSVPGYRLVYRRASRPGQADPGAAKRLQPDQRRARSSPPSPPGRTQTIISPRPPRFRVSLPGLRGAYGTLPATPTMALEGSVAKAIRQFMWSARAGGKRRSVPWSRSRIGATDTRAAFDIALEACYDRSRSSMGCRLTVGRLTLDQVVGVRIPAPQPTKNGLVRPRMGGRR